MTMHWDCWSRLASSPFESINNFVDDSDDYIQGEAAAENATFSMKSLPAKPQQA
jgi:hypothetical protein